MVMHPINQQVSSSELQYVDSEDIMEDDDGIIIVAIPSITWSKVVRIADRENLKTGEVLSLAISELYSRVSEE